MQLDAHVVDKLSGRKNRRDKDNNQHAAWRTWSAIAVSFKVINDHNTSTNCSCVHWLVRINDDVDKSIVVHVCFNI
jgi:hypothetical protein